jgi:hypothetical protein
MVAVVGGKGWFSGEVDEGASRSHGDEAVRSRSARRGSGAARYSIGEEERHVGEDGEERRGGEVRGVTATRAAASGQPGIDSARMAGSASERAAREARDPVVDGLIAVTFLQKKKKNRKQKSLRIHGQK